MVVHTDRVLHHPIIVKHLKFQDVGAVTVFSGNSDTAYVRKMPRLLDQNLKSVLRVELALAHCVLNGECRSRLDAHPCIQIRTEYHTVTGDVEGGCHHVCTRIGVAVYRLGCVHRCGTIAEVPHHTVARIVDIRSERNRFVRAELGVCGHLRVEDVIDEKLLLERYGFGTRRITVGFVESQPIAVCNESAVAM